MTDSSDNAVNDSTKDQPVGDQQQDNSSNAAGIQPADPVQGQTDAQITEASKLPGDPGTPFEPATDPAASLDDTHQVTDSHTNIDEHEAYDAGLPAAAEAQEPRDPGVADYNPPGASTDSTAADVNDDSDTDEGEKDALV